VAISPIGLLVWNMGFGTIAQQVCVIESFGKVRTLLPPNNDVDTQRQRVGLGGGTTDASFASGPVSAFAQSEHTAGPSQFFSSSFTDGSSRVP